MDVILDNRMAVSDAELREEVNWSLVEGVNPFGYTCLVKLYAVGGRDARILIVVNTDMAGAQTARVWCNQSRVNRRKRKVTPLFPPPDPDAEYSLHADRPEQTGNEGYLE